MVLLRQLWTKSRACRWVTVAVGGFALSLCISAGAGLVWLRTPSGNDWLAQRLALWVTSGMREGRLTIGVLRTDFWSYLDLRTLVLEDRNGAEVLRIESAQLDLHPRDWPQKRVHAEQVSVRGFRLDLHRDASGLTELQRMFGADTPSAEPWSGLPVALQLERVEVVGGHFGFDESVGIDGLVAGFRVHGEGARIEVADLSSNMILTAPAHVPAVARGTIVYTGDGVDLGGLDLFLPGLDVGMSGHIALTDPIALDVGTHLRHLDLASLYAWSRRHDLLGSFSGTASATGPLDALVLDARLTAKEPTEGEISAQVTANLVATPLSYRGSARVAGIRAEQLYRGLDKPMSLAGTLTFDGSGNHWPDDVRVVGKWEGEGTQSVAGFDLDRTEAAFTLDGGTLTLSESRLTGILGAIVATGDVDLTRGPMDLDVRGTLDIARLKELGVSGIGGAGSVAAHVTGDVQHLDQPILVEGTLWMAPFLWEDDVRFDTLTASFRTESVGADVRGTAAVTAHSGTAYGTAIEEVKATKLGFSRDVERTKLGGGANVANARYADYASLESAKISFRVELPAQGDLVAHADVYPDVFALRDFPGRGGEIAVDVVGDEVDLVVDLDSGSREMVGLTATFDLETRVFEAPRLRIAPTPRVLWEAPEAVTFTLTDSGIEDARVHIRSPLGEIELDGTLGRTGPVDAHLVARTFSLDAIAELFPEAAGGLAGTLDLDAVVQGDATGPDLSMTINADRVWLAEVSRWLDASGTLSGPSGALDVDLAIGVAGTPLARIEGTLPISTNLEDLGPDPSGRADVTAMLLPGSLTRLAWLYPGIPELPEGRISAQLDVHGALRNPRVTVSGVTEVAVRGWREPARTEFSLTRDGDALTLWTDVREGLTSRGVASGTGTNRLGEVFAYLLGEGPEPDFGDYTLYANDLSASAVLLAVPAHSLAAAAGLPGSFRGDLVGGLSVSGSPYEPVVEGGMHWLDAQIGEQTLEGAYLSLVPAEAGYLVDAQLAFPEQGSLSVVGAVPVEVDLREDLAQWAVAPLALEVGGDGVPLALATAVDPGLKDATGLVRVRGSLGGTLVAPDPLLRVEADGGAFTYLPLGLRAKGLQLGMGIAGHEVQLNELVVSTLPEGRALRAAAAAEPRPSRIAVTGSAHLDEGSLVDVDAQVALVDAWLSATPDASIRVGGGLRVQGDWPKFSVRGDPRLDVVQGRFLMDAASFLDVAPLDLDPTIRVHRGPVGEGVSGREEEPPFWAYSDVDVDVALGRNVQVKVILPFIEDLGALGAAVTSVDLDARLGSDEPLSFTMVDGVQDLKGEVEVIEGEVQVWLGRFSLTDGKVSFIGAEITNPTLDVKGEMRVSGGQVNVEIRGTPTEPTLTFQSNEWPEQSQIIMILLTGASPDELSDTQGMATAAAFAGLLLNSVFQGVRLGSFNIEPDGTVRVGFPMSNTLFGESVVSPTADYPDDRVGVTLEWSAARRLVLVGGVGDRKVQGEVLWELRF